jgi:hypothetical protein
MNSKQLKYSQKKVFNAIKQTRLRLFLFLMLIVAIPATIVAMTEIEHSTEAVSVVSGTTMASMLAIGNIEGVSDKDVAGRAISYKVWLIELSQIDDSSPFPKPNASREVGAIPLKAGERAHYFVAHDIPTYDSSGEKGDLTIDSTNTFAMIMGGVRDQLLNFIEEFVGAKFIVIFQECGVDEKYIIGTPCKPMVLSNYGVANNKDSRSITFTFTNRSINQYYKYVGSLLGGQPALHPAGTAALAVQAGVDTYRIPDGSSATYAITSFTGLAAHDEGRVITLIGEGTTKAATVAEAAGIILKDGVTWTARAGSRLVLRIFDTSTVIEVSRVQTV